MTTALSTAPAAYGLKGPSAAITVDNATPQGATYLRGNTVQTNGTSSLSEPNVIWIHRVSLNVSQQADRMGRIVYLFQFRSD